MIKIEHAKSYGWEGSVRGMRNPMNSWEKGDSGWEWDCNVEPTFVVGHNDLTLMQKLVKAGTDHSKFMRQIVVSMDITAPLYWWKEFDTYKVGTVANSCSTMHKIHDKKFALDDFSHEHLMTDSFYLLRRTVDILNEWRDAYLECTVSQFATAEEARTLKKELWWQMIQLLPSSYNQLRTVTLSYAVLRNMYFARKDHKLDEWRDFCKRIEELPYAKELICYG